MPIEPHPTWDSERTWETFTTGTFHGLIGGVELQKCADDLDRYREVIEISQPDCVIETGTRKGGSALWFQEQGLEVVTIDLDSTAGMEARNAGNLLDSIQYLGGHSAIDLPEAWMEWIKAWCDGRRVMVSLDSDHHSPFVQAEIATWAPFVSPGCYLVVEDGCFDMWTPDRSAVGGWNIPKVKGPLDAINMQFDGPLAQQHGVFWRDEELEAITPISHSPAGWWRKHE